MDIAKIVELLKLVTTVAPYLQELFASATAGLTNDQRIDLLRQAGVDLESSGLDWLKTQGYI
jgi:hypothetical protein